MAVVIETTLGDITVDLFIEQRPTTCLNFLKLCKMKFYNFNLFHTIRRGFIAQTGDPSGEGSGGESIFGLLEGPKKRFFSGEKMPRIRHTDAGLLSMVCTDEAMVGSQFFFTLGTDLDSLDGVHCVIGEVTEGHDVLRKLNDVICDETHRPYQDVRITHTVVLADPFNDPAGLRAPSRSPSPSAERLKGGRIAPDEDIDETHGKSAAELQEYIEEKEAKARATILEIVGDLPDADIAPPENVLFVCKLNPVTSDEDLEIIFSRFGKIVTCEVIRDKKSGDSLQYAFIEFSDKKSCEDAYFKMDNVLIDDRRIHVDFSQSVSKIKWLGKGRGVKHITDDDAGSKNRNKDSRQKARRSPSRDRYKPTKQLQRNNRDYEREKDRDNRQERDAREHKQSRRENNRDARKLSRSRSPIRERKDRSDRDKNSTRTSDGKSSRQSERDNKSSKHVGRENNDNYSHKSSLRHRETYHNGTANLDSSRSKATNSSRYKNNTDDVQNPTEEKRDKERHKKHRDNQDNKNGLEKDESETTTKSTNKENDKISKDNDLKRDKKKSSRRDSEQRNNDRSKERKLDNKVEKQDVAPKTPSPDVIKSSTKTKKEKAAKGSEKSKTLKKSKIVKKKRKPSTSSSSDSSSSSSSETSSSSESDNKKKKNKRKKRYSSTESSTSDSSTSSSSSSSTDSSSDSSSSSSDSDKKKRKIKKTVNKKTVKKARKK